MNGPFKVVRLGPKGAHQPIHMFCVAAVASKELVRTGESDSIALINGASGSDPAKTKAAVQKFCDALNEVFSKYMDGGFHEDAPELAQKPFVVIRKCCLGPCCSTPHGPYEQVLVTQWLAWDEVACQEVAKKWSEYSAFVEQVGPETLSKLEPSSAAWLQDKLKNPGRIG